MALKKVVLVGRANVGKSTIFNKIAEKKLALTAKEQHTTRDCQKSAIQWNNKSFLLYDTAGLDAKPDDILAQQAQQASQKIIRQADIFLFVLDGRSEVLPDDEEIALFLKKQKKPVFLIINKIDNPKQEKNILWNEIFSLSLSPSPFLVSGLTGRGLGDLLDAITQKITSSSLNEKEEKNPKITFLGKPNVGKSSLLNALLKKYSPQEDAVLVTDIPYTTREIQTRNIDTPYGKFSFIDTAGLRRKAKIPARSLEKLSIKQTLTTLKNSDLAILVLDATQPLTAQDKKIANLIVENHKGLLIAFNKSDLLPKEQKELNKLYQDYLKQGLPSLSWAPVVLISARTGKNLEDLLQKVKEITLAQKKEISNDELSLFLKKALRLQSPVQAKGNKRPKLISLEQTETNPPCFSLTLRPKDTLHTSYLRFLEKKLRQEFNLFGLPLQIKINRKYG